MKPELHYGESDCPVTVPDNFPKDDELHFQIELLDFCKVKARLLVSGVKLFEHEILFYGT